MPTLTDPPAGRPAAAMGELAADIWRRHRNAIRELRVDVVEDGLVLSGVAYSFYGKQVCQHEVLRRTKLALRANRMVVDPRPSGAR